ncbi:MAG: S8 family serine peptidase [Alphaproteobacteria bacterium]
MSFARLTDTAWSIPDFAAHRGRTGSGLDSPFADADRGFAPTLPGLPSHADSAHGHGLATWDFLGEPATDSAPLPWVEALSADSPWPSATGTPFATSWSLPAEGHVPDGDAFTGFAPWPSIESGAAESIAAPLTIEQTVAGINLTTTGSAIEIFTVGEVTPVDAGVQPATNLSSGVINLDDFRADTRFVGIDGSGFASVILDTGIDLKHAFFGPDSDGNGIADRIVYQYDFGNGDSNASDVNGHGSNVASIVGSQDGTYTGVAPGVDIIALKVFQDSGAGYFSYIENALRWVVNNAVAYNIVSVNMSLGDSGNYQTPVQLYGIADEMAALANLGVVVVSASGNNFYGFNSVQGVSYPAADPNSLSIGAVYDGNTGGWSYGSGAVAYSSGSGYITPFSQRDDTLTTVFAPGAPITGAGPTGGLVTMHGTSQAAPHVTGVVALAQDLAMQELGRKLTVTEFESLIKSTGTTIVDGDNENDNVVNTGLSFPLVDVKALGEAIVAMAPPKVPTLSIAALDAEKAEGDSGATAFTFTVTRGGDTASAVTVDYAVAGSVAGVVSGTSAHESADAAGYHQHYFYGATDTMSVGTGDTLFVYVKIDPSSPPTEIMVHWNDGSWGHRAYWGANDLAIGTDGTASRQYMGPLPTAGEWVRLEVPASAVALEGRSVNGMGFILNDGSAQWDRAGVSHNGTDQVWFDDAVPAGATQAAVNDSWSWIEGGTAAASDFVGGAMPSGTVSFAAGETAKTVTVLVAGDTNHESDEGFKVTLSNPRPAARSPPRRPAP